jgi:GTP-binding protein Era
VHSCGKNDSPGQPTIASLMHRSGFVNIMGRPNVGKSTLMNKLVGDRMSIVNKKPQTTRHRILGIVSEDDYQVVFSDTPGLIEDPKYAMQKSLNKFALSALEDADILLLMTDPGDPLDMPMNLEKALVKLNAPVALVLNKVDVWNENDLEKVLEWWKTAFNFSKIFRISALSGEGVDELFQWILDEIEEGPAYFPKDQLTDRPERFFASEFIRQHILEIYHQEIPYSCEVIITDFKEAEDIIRIYATIIVNRASHKPIIIGKKGSLIKKLGIASRKSLEEFFRKKVYLE